MARIIYKTEAQTEVEGRLDAARAALRDAEASLGRIDQMLKDTSKWQGPAHTTCAAVHRGTVGYAWNVAPLLEQLTRHVFDLHSDVVSYK